MNEKERFDQIESLLVSLMQKVDRLEQFTARQEQANARQEQTNARFDQRLDGLGEQMGDVISILKMSAERQSQSDERQERMLRQIEAQGRRTDATQAEILRLMQQWDEQKARNEATDKRLGSLEPRVQRLEDDALQQAS